MHHAVGTLFEYVLKICGYRVKHRTVTLVVAYHYRNEDIRVISARHAEPHGIGKRTLKISAKLKMTQNTQ